ncbi:MAG: ferrous iron transport protein B [Nanoarchaeota archaeon]|nr:ferrous iron transport protein B [Nanoarchaeota archaeon]
MTPTNFNIALAGNPNCGKTTLFNNLTGMKQHVGNWPGKTVEKKEGFFYYNNLKINIIDLPGTYSLTAYSMEEIVTRDYIVNESPDIVINIVDASNLERNLYLTVQLIELGANVILALNMNRLANKKEMIIDSKKLSELLGIPIVKIEAIDKTGRDELLSLVMKVYSSKKKTQNKIHYGNELNSHIEQLQRIIDSKIKNETKYLSKWLAIKIIEEDEEIINYVLKEQNGKTILHDASKIRKHLMEVYGDNVDAIFADARYGFVAGAVAECVNRPKVDKVTTTDKIDRIVTNKFLGIPIFLLLMYLMFQITFSAANPLVGLIQYLFGLLSQQVTIILSLLNSPDWLISLFVDSIIGGVGSVIVFLPNIFLLFLMISFLEDSGYLARAAFIMDKLMHQIGLHGKSFIPLILGFGCNVPAVMATRTLDNKRDRLLTILITPFMSCSARLPVYILFVSAFFPSNQGLIVFSLYLLGVVLAITAGLVFKTTVFRGTTSAFVMELPPYRLPTIKGSLIHMWERGKLFIIKAGTIIFLAVLVIWLLSNLPLGVLYASESSIIGIIGKFIAPIFAPLGFGVWQAAVALIFGVVAKEVIVGTFGALFNVGTQGLGVALTAVFTPLSAYSFMVFTLLYTPCIPTLASIKRETASVAWMFFVAAYLAVVAWIISFIVYQGGLLLGFT